MSDIVLTVYITSFNRGKYVYNSLNRMLRYYKEDDIEFIISDNASDDETVFWLNKIDDCRVRVFINAENYGFEKNTLLHLDEIRGKYFMYMVDRDYLQMRFFPSLINELKNGNADVYFVWPFWDQDYVVDLKRGEKLSKSDAAYLYRVIRHPGLDIRRTSSWRESFYDFLGERDLISLTGEELLTVTYSVRDELILNGNIEVYKDPIKLQGSISGHGITRMGQSRKEILTKNEGLAYFAPEAEHNYLMSVVDCVVHNDRIKKSDKRLLIYSFYKSSLYYGNYLLMMTEKDKHRMQRYNYKAPIVKVWFVRFFERMVWFIRETHEYSIISRKFNIMIVSLSVRLYVAFVRINLRSRFRGIKRKISLLYGRIMLVIRERFLIED